MKFEITMYVILGLGLAFISYQDHKYCEYKERFEAECESKGGVMSVPMGAGGYPEPECRDPSFSIDVDIER